jgi:adsorption protein B
MAIGDARRVAWDKTTHVFPSVAATSSRQPLGQILITEGALTASQLQQVLERSGRRRIGRALLEQGAISSQQLAAALAVQQGLEWRDLDPFSLDASLLERLGERLAFKYSVLPLALEDGMLVLGRESAASAVAVGVISRQLGLPCRQVLVPQGRVQVGLMHGYRPGDSSELGQVLHQLAQDESRAQGPLERLCRHLILLGDLTVELGLLNQAVLSQALISFEPLQQRLGDHLVQMGLLSEANLQVLLAEQQKQRQLGLEAVRLGV